MERDRDPRAWMVDDDPLEKHDRVGSHAPARDDGNWRKTRIHVVQTGAGGIHFAGSGAASGTLHSVNIHRGTIWHFSRIELQHLLLATAAFTVALALMFSGGILGAISSGPLAFSLFCILSLITLAPAFILHEVAHKVVARHYGCWAEFRADPAGLRFGIILAAILGIVFMSPGAVMVAGKTTRPQFGRIALAGPVTNMGLWAAGYLLWVALGGFFALIDTLITYWLWGNAILAAFNMIPIGPLDGRKIKAWSDSIYYAWLVTALGILYLTFTRTSVF